MSLRSLYLGTVRGVLRFQHEHLHLFLPPVPSTSLHWNPPPVPNTWPQSLPLIPITLWLPQRNLLSLIPKTSLLLQRKDPVPSTLLQHLFLSPKTSSQNSSAASKHLFLAPKTPSQRPVPLMHPGLRRAILWIPLTSSSSLRLHLQLHLFLKKLIHNTFFAINLSQAHYYYIPYCPKCYGYKKIYPPPTGGKMAIISPSLICALKWECFPFIKKMATSSGSIVRWFNTSPAVENWLESR